MSIDQHLKETPPLEQVITEFRRHNEWLVQKTEYLQYLLGNAREDTDTLEAQSEALKARLMKIEEPLRSPGHNVCGCKRPTSLAEIFVNCGSSDTEKDLAQCEAQTDDKNAQKRRIDDINWAQDVACSVCQKLPSQVALEKKRSDLDAAVYNAEMARSGDRLEMYKGRMQLYDDLQTRTDYLSHMLAQHIELYQLLLYRLQEAQQDDFRVLRLPGGQSEVFSRVEYLIEENASLQGQLFELENQQICMELLPEKPACGSKSSREPLKCQKAIGYNKTMDWFTRFMRQILLAPNPCPVPTNLQGHKSLDDIKNFVEWLFDDWVMYKSFHNRNEQESTQHVRAGPSERCVEPHHNFHEQLDSSPRASQTPYQGHASFNSQTAIAEMRRQVFELFDLVQDMHAHSTSMVQQGKSKRGGTSLEMKCSNVTPGAVLVDVEDKENSSALPSFHPSDGILEDASWPVGLTPQEYASCRSVLSEEAYKALSAMVSKHLHAKQSAKKAWTKPTALELEAIMRSQELINEALTMQARPSRVARVRAVRLEIRRLEDGLITKGFKVRSPS